jgi:hypothetical protein
MSVEPWLRGGHEDIDPIQAAVLYSFEHAKTDINQWISTLSDDQLWEQRGKVGSPGWHARHIAGSVDRLTTYAIGSQLSNAQLAALESEKSSAGPSRTELMAFLDETLNRCGDVIRSLDPSTWRSIREIGRKRTPVPLGVLLVHIAEHTQRHVGELIVTVKLVRGDWQSTESANVK